ncbi:MAG TPA: asparagine synthase (glutamine-hydrolyzing), partial [Longimicrobium sp.]|nr:asparagine synthase (glutamine-hydrolyzing) [Longimicrobium sp.]
MCGFAGFTDLRGERPADSAVVARMAATLIHRGPDSAGAFVEGCVGMGFRRLSIVDLAGGDQPIASEDGRVVLMCNGEIYNHRELRRELEGRGHRFCTRSDVEVILHLYEEEGDRLVERLDGQFSFVVHDRRRGRFLMARDPVGVTPLFWAEWDGVLAFGSEIKALLEHPAARREVDLTGLDQVFAFPGVVSPRTLFRGVRSLPPGHLLTVDDGRVRVAEYWDLDYPREGEADYSRSEAWYTARLAELFAASVERRLQADVPVGFYLSGGLDSSMIAGMVGRLTPGTPRHSFSISFGGDSMCEGRYQRMVAAQ